MANLIKYSPKNRQILYYPRLPVDLNSLSDADVRSGMRNALVQDTSISGQAASLAKSVINRFSSLGTGLSAKASTKYVFTGVQDLTIKYARDVATQYGLMSFSFVPWYTKAVVVSIHGNDYLGGFDMDGVSQASTILTNMVTKKQDPIVDCIRKELLRVDTLRRKPLSSNNNSNALSLISSIQIGQEGQTGFYRIAGFVTDLSFTERVGQPGLIDYSVTYLGIDYAWILSSIAEQRGLETKSLLQ